MKVCDGKMYMVWTETFSFNYDKIICRKKFVEKIVEKNLCQTLTRKTNEINKLL